MEIEKLLDVLFNFGILAICSILVTFIADKRLNIQSTARLLSEKERSLGFSVMIGLIFGLTCAALIMTAHHADNGNVVDTRAAPAILSGIIGGPIAGIATFLLGGVARLFVGGNFVIGGVISIGIYVLVGILFRSWLSFEWKNRGTLTTTRMLIMGVASVLFILPCFFIDQDFDTSLKALAAVAPVLLIHNPLGLLILGSTLRITLKAIADRHALEVTSAKLKQESKNLENERARMWNAIESLPEAFVLYDSADRLVICNSRYKQVYAASVESILPGATFESILRFGIENGQYPDAKGREDEWLEERMEMHRNPSGPIEQHLPGNQYLQIHEVKTDLGETVGFRVDVSELRHQQQALEQQTVTLREQSSELESQAVSLTEAKRNADHAAVTDALTSLGNRRGLDVHLAELNTRLVSNQKLTLLHIDVDRFKAINDMFGHAAGDHVLVSISQILRNSTRKDEYVARVGGDEFVIVAIGRDSQEPGEAIARRIIGSCRQPFEFNGSILRIGVSIGIAASSSVDSSQLMENADIALYEAKNAGRDQFSHYNAEFRVAALERKWLADEILEAFRTDQFHPHFQPQLSSNGRTLIGVEALVRWQHPTKGFIAPLDFLPIIKDQGRLAEIDYLMLRKTLDTVHRLKANGLYLPKVSVNLSYQGLTNQALFTLLDELRPWPCRLAFELLETIDFDQEAKELSLILEKLRENEVEIELDDFGSGHASITTLLTVRPNRIKIDRQLITAVDDSSSKASTLVSAIADMGIGLEIDLTAEGIEKESQAIAVRNLGCSVLQGFFFAKPMSEQDLTEWMTTNNNFKPFVAAV